MLETTLDCGVVNWGQTMTDEGNGFWIGHSYNRDRWLEGNISEVRIWNKVLTSAEINAKDHFYQVEPDADGLVLTGSSMRAPVLPFTIIAEMRTMLLQWNQLTWTGCGTAR